MATTGFLRYELVVKHKSILQVPLLHVHRGHSLHLHPGSEVAPWGDVLIDGDVAAKLA